jgi:tetraacyldisaccharide 4'-kinase
MARGTTHRLIRWLWTSRRLDASLVRLALLPASGAWRAGMNLRAMAFGRGWIASHPLPAPAIAVGNLTVGGSGKTPVASWIASWLADQGITPGILLRGYRGGDEALVHRERVPGARVVANPDRRAGGAQAVAEGARVLVLDDAFQRLDIRRDLNIAVVSAETSRAVPWSLPAGPWREGWHALRRADLLVVTRKRADAETARRYAATLRGHCAGAVAIARLEVNRYVGLVSARVVPADRLAGARVVAASGIANPEAFIAQTKALGAAVQAATWPDHHEFRDEDLAWLAKASRQADFLVVTQKDAVKLRDRWPASAPEPLVAMLDLEWESGQDEVELALRAVAEPPVGGPRPQP